MIKRSISDLALFGGDRLFQEPKSTSSLAQPDFDQFLRYSKVFFEQRYYTNNGILVRQLEERLALFHQARFCITFCSGFWAIALTIMQLALPGRSEIVMPSLTYRRMADIAAWAGLKPRFCEVGRDNLAMNAATVRECINDETAIIMAMHPIVNCCDVEELVDLGRESGIPVIFDSVESVYEKVAGGKIGGFGDAECFSMHASKLLNGFEGGYVTTNNAELADHLSHLRNFGFLGEGKFLTSGGLNAKLNEVHAAMALANLDLLDRLVADNEQRYRVYQRGLAGLKGIRLLEFDENFQSGFKNIVVELQDDWPLTRDQTVALLNAENILARAYYSPALHQKDMAYPHIPATLEITDDLARRYMNLPCGEFVSSDDICEVIRLLAFIQANADGVALALLDRQGAPA